MAGQDVLVVDLNDVAVFPPEGSNAKPKIAEGEKQEDSDTSADELNESTDEEEEEEEEMARSAHFEPATLPWGGDKHRRLLLEQDDDVLGPEEKDSGLSQDLSEERSQADEEVRSKAKWRESMPEGERWRDDEIELQRNDKGDGSLADDEDEEDEGWMSEKPSTGFTPHVTIVCPTTKELPEEEQHFREEEEEEERRELSMDYHPAAQFYPEWEDQDDKYYVCSEKLQLVLATLAAGCCFPLLVWGGYALLPFDPPKIHSAPYRVLYALRCSFFAIIPIILGVLVQGIARLRFSSLKPLYQGNLVDQEVMVHWHYVNESLSLFLFYFLQLAVMATYISQDLLKLVPLLTIIFVFGRLIYWVCLALGSSIRAFGFGFSFLPVLVMLVANIYYVCSAVGPSSVFDVAPPATDPPPRLRWWL
ncbi:transmembrane protein 79 [Poeciliopsis prolifica]|uniref:transmembrane protein 79 n=1 Tax=Poeciliopsis prolifica TaxID=188132 RepID=UPI0024131A86|nr:transmembrane protein 79 [Poeciliopsis prolifica]XP_054909805.1 transmembrane protein 79 [Poeciliopsis prolifica]XP_054909806.1 transmembrane protein 79 [Poeciliopsis prolifica]